MRDFGTVTSAACRGAGCEEQRRYFRPVARSGEAVSRGDRRRAFLGRWATIMAAPTAA